MSLENVKPNMKMGIVIALLTGIFFALGAPFSRAAYAEGANFVFIAIVSIFSRGFFLTLYCLLSGKKLFASSKTFKRTFIGAFFHALGMAALYGALVYLKVAMALMLCYLYPLILYVFLLWRGEEKANYATAMMAFLVLVGMSFVLKFWGNGGDVHWGGAGLGLLCAFGIAGRMYIHGKQLETRSPYVVGAENFIIAFLFTLLLVFWKAPVLPQSPEGFMWAGLCGLVMGVGSIWAFSGMAMTGAFAWCLLGNIEPIYAAVLSALFFGELLNAEQYFGMAVVVAGLIGYQYVRKYKDIRVQNEEPM